MLNVFKKQRGNLLRFNMISNRLQPIANHLPRPKPNKKIRNLLYILAVPCALWFILYLAVVLNPISKETLKGFSESRRILDSVGNLLREVVNRDGARARWTALDNISPLVADATLAAEDARFYSHGGIDYTSVIRALKQNLTPGGVRSGASTITMQLARLIYKLPHSAKGKLAQTYHALRLERALNKKDILTQYLNRAYYGAGTVGVEAASRRYFGKPSTHLSLAEAALLSGLPKAPSTLNPLRNPQGAKRRQRYVLKRLLDTGKIAKEDYLRALHQPLHYVRRPPKLTAMHFCDTILGMDLPAGDVLTTLDSGLQQQVETLVAQHVAGLKHGGLTNAAVVVLDNETGSVLAMVGSSDYYNPDGGSVNGTTAKRQPGSTLKPFTYALAFEEGFTPASVLADVESRYLGKEGTLFTPQNYSRKFSGPVLAGEALGRSLNVPAIRLANAVGVNDLLAKLKQAGFDSLDRDANYYGLGLTLGNGEVTLLELAQGYAAFARGGVACKAQCLRRPGRRPGPHKGEAPPGPPMQGGKKKVIGYYDAAPCSANGVPRGASSHPAWRGLWPSESPPEGAAPPRVAGPPEAYGKRVFSEAVSFLVTDILSDQHLRIRAFGAGNPLVLDFPMAVKTGTSSNWRDNWVVGYTRKHTVAIWAGDFKGKPMNQVSGTIGAGPLFHKIANLVVRRYEKFGTPLPLKPPTDVEQIVVCSLSGKKPTGHCSNCCSVFVLKTNRPRNLCNMHQVKRIDKRNGLLASIRCPKEFAEERVYEVLPATYTHWQATHHTERPPIGYSPLCPPDGITANALVVTSPRNNDVFLLEPGYERNTQTLRLEGEVNPSLPEVVWLVDGKKTSKKSRPYDADWPMTKGRHTLQMMGGGMKSDTVHFEIR
ncbi:MAG: hypothetical protein GY765_00625 [bacterium]|nr:hypothetical protein [bacterium]